LIIREGNLRNGERAWIGRLVGSSRASLQIYRYIALRLALQAAVAQGGGPTVGLAIVFQAAILHRFVVALADVVKDDARAFVAGHGKANTV
jgi:hypothetical protein